MTIDELDKFLEANKHIEHHIPDDKEEIHFRNTRIDYYKNDENRATAVSFKKLEEMGAEDLEFEINRGLMVEGITRVTGYMTKVSGWNPGKLGELKDRNRANNL